VSVSHAALGAVTDVNGEVDTGQVTVLAELFTQVTDPRKARGVRHRLSAVLTVLTLALLCGARNFRQAADRVAELPQVLLAAAGARRHPVLAVWLAPSRDTLRRVVEAVDAAAVDRLVCAWLAQRIGPRSLAGLSLDGKTVRNSGGGTDTDVQLFSAMRHDQAVVIAQVRVPADTTEVTQIRALLDPVDLTGLVVTADAAHPSAETAAYLRGRDAHYVFTVKANKPTLLSAIADRLPAATSDTCAYTTTERRSGQHITRQIWTAEATGIDFPDAAQVFRLRRDTFDATGQRTSKQVIHGITSLNAATAADLAGYSRAHWGIENKIHWVRDVLYGEDDHHAYLGAVAHTMAALRNLAIALIRLAGHTRIKQILERHHANKMLIPALLNASSQ
jgi:predicted transposase YbfD/YdcC